MKTTISTRNYELTHGKKPTSGYALWVFKLSESDTQKPKEVWLSGNWKQVKAQAAQACREGGFRVAVLLP